MDQMKTRDTYGLDALNINGSYFVHIVISSFINSSHLLFFISTGNKGVVNNDLFLLPKYYFLFLMEKNTFPEK